MVSFEVCCSSLTGHFHWCQPAVQFCPQAGDFLWRCQSIPLFPRTLPSQFTIRIAGVSSDLAEVLPVHVVFWFKPGLTQAGSRHASWKEVL